MDFGVFELNLVVFGVFQLNFWFYTRKIAVLPSKTTQNRTLISAPRLYFGKIDAIRIWLLPCRNGEKRTGGKGFKVVLSIKKTMSSRFFTVLILVIMSALLNWFFVGVVGSRYRGFRFRQSLIIQMLYKYNELGLWTKRMKRRLWNPPRVYEIGWKAKNIKTRSCVPRSVAKRAQFHKYGTTRHRTHYDTHRFKHLFLLYTVFTTKPRCFRWFTKDFVWLPGPTQPGQCLKIITNFLKKPITARDGGKNREHGRVQSTIRDPGWTTNFKNLQAFLLRGGGWKPNF